MWKARSILVASFTWMALGPFAAPGEEYRPRVGALHPDFTLPRISDRRPVSLSDFRGKRVLLIQFASW